MAAFKEVLQEVLRAWDVLPGGKNYSPDKIEYWLDHDMAPAILMVKIALRKPTEKEDA